MELRNSKQSTTGQAEARPAVSKRVSPLFEGATLFQQMNKSAFGRFDAAIRGVDSHLQLPLTPLPKVIVIGGKNAGKSSLLESITKCAIFPRGSSLCTKRPIKLQLQQVKTSAECSVHVLHDDKSVLLTSIDDLLGTVEAIMKPLDSISDDEIVVRICQMDVPTIELVDLPGIQLYPPKLEAETVSLVKKYLADPLTLVLCVVDATIPSLDSSAAVKLIREEDKLSSAILALTKADLLHDQEVVAANIFDRILCQSTEMHELAGLAGCVSLVNRKHTDQLTLLEAETIEAAVFQDLFQSAAGVYSTADIQTQLVDNTTSSQLIAKLDALLHTHILEHWKPAALKSIHKAMKKVEKSAAALGICPDQLSLMDVVTVLLGKAAESGISGLAKMPINVADIPTANGSKSCTLSELDSIVKAQHLEWGSYDWAASGNLLLDLVKTAVASITPSYVKGVQAAFANAFGTRPPWRLQRFASMKAAFLDSTIPSVVEAALANCKPDIDRMVVNAFADYYQQTRPGYTFATLHKSIRGCILLQLQAATSDADKLLKQAPNVDQLKLHEDSLTAGQRHEHSAKLLQLQKAARTIEGIAAASPTGSSGSRVPAGAQTAEVHTDHNQTSSQLPVPAGPNKYVFTWLVCEDAQKPAESDDTWEPRTATPSTKRNRQDPKTGDGERKKVKHSVAK